MSPSKCFELKSLQPFYRQADRLAQAMHKYLDGNPTGRNMLPDVDYRAECFVNGLDLLLVDIQEDRL